MIVHQTIGNKRIDSFSLESLEFKIKDANLIFDILTSKLYNNPLRTMIQEYLSNALDAHKEAGIEDKPIQIILPGNDNQNLIIRDFGVGLSLERIKEIFIYLGESTKNTTNKFIGGFGIGAKSAFAYTNIINLTSFVNGKKYVYTIYLADNKIPKLDLLDVSFTEEENGVEISIPINISDFHSVAKYVEILTMFWPVKPKVYIKKFDKLFEEDIKYPIISYENQKIGFKVLDKNYSLFNSLIIVNYNGLPYDIDSLDLQEHFKLSEYYNSNHLVIDAKVGDIDISVNREKIKFTDKTKEFFISKLDKITKFYENEIKKLLRKNHKKLFNYRDNLDFSLITNIPKILKDKISVKVNDFNIVFNMNDSHRVIVELPVEFNCYYAYYKVTSISGNRKFIASLNSPTLIYTTVKKPITYDASGINNTYFIKVNDPENQKNKEIIQKFIETFDIPEYVVSFSSKRREQYFESISDNRYDIHEISVDVVTNYINRYIWIPREKSRDVVNHLCGIIDIFDKPYSVIRSGIRLAKKTKVKTAIDFLNEVLDTNLVITNGFQQLIREIKEKELCKINDPDLDFSDIEDSENNKQISLQKAKMLKKDLQLCIKWLNETPLSKETTKIQEINKKIDNLSNKIDKASELKERITKKYPLLLHFDTYFVKQYVGDIALYLNAKYEAIERRKNE